MFHDVGWPHAFRDDYFDADLIPEDHRHPVAGPDESRGLYPGDPGLRRGRTALPAARPPVRAALATACARPSTTSSTRQTGLRFVRVPAFFGLGVVWHEDAPVGRERMAAAARPMGRAIPLIERLEANRVRRSWPTCTVPAAELWKERERPGPPRGAPAPAARVERLRARRAAVAACASAPGSPGVSARSPGPRFGEPCATSAQGRSRPGVPGASGSARRSGSVRRHEREPSVRSSSRSAAGHAGIERELAAVCDGARQLALGLGPPRPGLPARPRSARRARASRPGGAPPTSRPAVRCASTPAARGPRPARATGCR